MRAIIGLCNGLNLCVTAEGVETEAQAMAAFGHGAHQAQGFLFGKPVPASGALQMVAGSEPLRLIA
jgi:EAL domain-containing protein (putative c-di-GMP-specific phosphodiesterase class I)